MDIPQTLSIACRRYSRVEATMTAKNTLAYFIKLIITTAKSFVAMATKGLGVRCCHKVFGLTLTQLTSLHNQPN